jgi:hypothetical protein
MWCRHRTLPARTDGNGSRSFRFVPELQRRLTEHVLALVTPAALGTLTVHVRFVRDQSAAVGVTTIVVRSDRDESSKAAAIGAGESSELDLGIPLGLDVTRVVVDPSGAQAADALVGRVRFQVGAEPRATVHIDVEQSGRARLTRNGAPPRAKRGASREMQRGAPPVLESSRHVPPTGRALRAPSEYSPGNSCQRPH